ncbi:MAG: DUF3823 domain-containing protein [Clostridiales bacterium]|nr:DUF3823 domain-containing protein [Clostridiales bacterium]
MKKLHILGAAAAMLMSMTSCEVFELDNYDEPQETLWGEVVDAATGERVLTDQGSEGIRVRLTELSWGDNVEHNPDFYAMPDGTFQNTKIFKGHYYVRIDGPFIPLVRETPDGVLLADECKEVDIKGTTKVKFEVQPFLNVKIVGTPQVSNGQIKAKVVVERAVSKADFRSKVEPTRSEYSDDLQNLTDIQLFVSYSSSVGYRARDERWSSALTYQGDAFEGQFGKEITITTNGEIPSGRRVYIRAAARINYSTAEVYRYNYSEPMQILIP